MTVSKNSKPTPPKKRQGVVKNGRNTPPKADHLAILINDALWLVALVLTVYTALALASFTMDDPAWSRSVDVVDQAHNLGGVMGAYLADIAYYLVGLSAWWLVLAAVVLLVKSFHPLTLQAAEPRQYRFLWGTGGMLLLLLASPLLEHMLWRHDLAEALPVGAGGLWGRFLAPVFAPLLGLSGSLIVLLLLMLLGISLLTQVSWLVLVEKLGMQLEWLWLKLIKRPHEFVRELPKPSFTRRMIQHDAANPAPTVKPEAVSSNRKPIATPTPVVVQTSLFDDLPDESSSTSGNLKNNKTATSLPAVSLLRAVTSEPSEIAPEQLQHTAERIEAKLAEFGVSVTVLSATAGPVITRYEIEPAQGIKGSQIVNLNKDLARALSLQSVRIVETIAGKSSMGIELPNAKRHDVALSEIIAANVFTQAASKLTLAMGKDIAGVPVVADLAKMPHLLVAGTTGSGKSVAVNSMIVSMLYKATPEEVRFIMVDPKMLELSVYQDIPHLLAPVVTDMKQAGNALNWCVAEMEKRYRLLAHVGVRQLDSFNQKIRQAQQAGEPIVNPFSLNPDEPEPLSTLPYIVVVIDELADLMMVEGKKVEQQIARLAQKARAAGIHLILATQRPSVDVITGLIKANIPTRISFQVSSRIDSRTILDQGGAENLLGKGDMLFLPPGTAEPTRLHGAFVADEEVHQIVSFLKRQGRPDYIDGLLSGEAASAGGLTAASGGAEGDELFDQAVAFILDSRKTSISSLQRHLRIGYNRAANLMESLEQAGIVSAAELGGSRRILARKADED